MKVESTRFYLISTALGTMAVQSELVSDYDVDAVIRNRAMSQARSVQFVNVSKQIDSNTALPNQSLPSIFQGTEEELKEG